MRSGVGATIDEGHGAPGGLHDVDHLRDVHGPDGLEELDRRLAVLCRERGPLVSGRLGWTKVRLLAGLPREEDVGRWIARAERLTADRLAKRVRAVDRYSADEESAAPRYGGGLLELSRGRRSGSRSSPRPGPASSTRSCSGSSTASRTPTPSSSTSACGARSRASSRSRMRLFRTALCTVRRRIEAETGRLPTAGEALDAMLEHVFAAWGQDAKVPARHRVLARDGWRCAAPGCSSMQNLHDHHVRLRSAGGSDALENRVTLCAFHHLRGVHAGRLRCTGRAPEGLTWQFGLRPGAPPLLSYRSGDVQIPDAAGP